MMIMQTYKVMVDGSQGCGKTTFVNFLEKGFSPLYIRTLGCEITPVRTSQACFNLWDMAGNMQCRGLDNGYFVEAQGFFLCFDLTSLASLFWAVERAKSLPVQAPIIFIGMKQDIELPHVALKAKEVLGDLPYIKISSKRGEGVREALAKMHSFF